MPKKPLILIIEKDKNSLWGRLAYEDNLIVDNATTIPALEKKMKKLLKAFHDLEPETINFDVQYDLAAIFEKFNFLKITAIAERANMNAALLRQYAAGIKHPSIQQAKKIEAAIHEIGKELSAVTVYAA
jgi:hypothetical protein